MSDEDRYATVTSANVPRFIIEYAVDANNNDQFKWGAVGKVPMLNLISALVKMQRLEHEWPEDGSLDDRGSSVPSNQVVMVWHGDMDVFEVFRGENVPSDPLVGIAEVIKAGLVGAIVTGAQVRAPSVQSSALFGPDGRPFGQ